MTRDPRIDPRPGDAVRSQTGAMRYVEHVSDVGSPNCMVEWIVGRFGYSAPIDEWDDLNENSEVVTVAEVGE